MENGVIKSARDAEILLDLIDNPPEPNEALKRAVKRYQDEVIEAK